MARGGRLRDRLLPRMMGACSWCRKPAGGGDTIADNGLLEAGSALGCTPGLHANLEQVRDRSAQ